MGQAWEGGIPGKEKSLGWTGTTAPSDGWVGTTAAIVVVVCTVGPQPRSDSGRGCTHPLQPDYPSIPRIPSAPLSSWCQSHFFFLLVMITKLIFKYLPFPHI